MIVPISQYTNTYYHYGCFPLHKHTAYSTLFVPNTPDI